MASCRVRRSVPSTPSPRSASRRATGWCSSSTTSRRFRRGSSAPCGRGSCPSPCRRCSPRTTWRRSSPMPAPAPSWCPSPLPTTWPASRRRRPVSSRPSSSGEQAVTLACRSTRGTTSTTARTFHLPTPDRIPRRSGSTARGRRGCQRGWCTATPAHRPPPRRMHVACCESPRTTASSRSPSCSSPTDSATR